jgi:predicted Rossmann fold flavoprotein
MTPPAQSSSSIADVAVIGAGGAGLLAGIAAARNGARTVLYERMKTPARKVAISGGGRCNFSNTLDARKFVRLFGDRNAAKLGNSLRALSNEDVIKLLGAYGVEGQVERNYRLYTKSGRGMDVVKALVSEFEKSGGKLVPQARILTIGREEAANAFTLEGKFGDFDEVHRARTVVICTGGLSYPVTGSTGDGYAWARSFGHTVTELRAALVGLTIEEKWTRELQGLAWPDAQVSLLELDAAGKPTGKALCTEHAEILFTHFGMSGPAIIDVSNTFVASKLKRARLTIDYFPALQRDELDRQLLERFKQYPNRTAARALDGMLPNRLLEHLEKQLGPDAQTLVTRLPKTARQKLLESLKHTQVTVVGTRGIEFGEVTAGGIEWDQIDPATLESKLAPGLFFAGEVLDLAGRCGGFNLQAAFSTGFLAGQSAARKALGSH